MFKIFENLSDENKITDLKPSEKNLLIASILMECAKEDGEISEIEISQIKIILSSKLKLKDEDIKVLLEQAILESNQRVELYSVIKKIREISSEDEINDLFISMWEIILADDVIDDFESTLMRKLVGLFHITDRDSAEAKRTALQKIKNQQSEIK